MKPVLSYLLQVIAISAIFYSYYHLFLRNKKFHGYNRFYLLLSLATSIITPFLNIPVYFESKAATPSSILHTLTTITPGTFEDEISILKETSQNSSYFNWSNAALVLYGVVFLLLIIRFVISIVKIIRLKKKFPVEKIDTIDFINTNEPNTPFSFFRNLFWNKKIALDSDEGQQILRHECFHIEQNHSYDIIFAEIVSVVFWMNPFFYLIKKEIKTIHEFLADQFAANVNEEWNYAELLLMQLLGSPTQRLTNPFFHNQIKRRIAMITTSKKTSYRYLRKLLVLPVAIIIAALFAFRYKSKEVLPAVTHPLGKTITVVIDAGHGESDPGIIATDGTKESDITLQLAQKIKQLNKNDRIHIVLTRNSKETVDLKKRSNIANALNPDLFISLHANASENNNNESGFEVYISKRNSAHYAENKIFGAILLNYFTNIYKTINKIQQQDQGIWVLDNSHCPSALIECGYITNRQDLNFMKDPVNQNKIAESILNSIEQFSMQKESPDFEDKKKQVSDTTKPVVKINKDAGGKISATLNDVPVKGLYIDKQYGSAAFILANGSLTVISKENVSALKKQYQETWDEFCKSFESDLSQKNKNQDEDASKDNIVFTSTEIDPSFPGGEHAWLSYLQKNLNANVATDNNAPQGSYTVWVEFLVAKDGTVSNIKALTNHGFGMEQEVVKLFDKGQKWLPAIQNGKKVNAYKKQPVTFVIHEEKVGS